MSWTALVPLKAATTRKSRLSDSLSGAARFCLSETLFHHLLGVLARCPEVGRIAVLSETRPQGWAGLWLRDHGGGLNVELGTAARALGGENLLVIHADLPAVSTEDIAALILAGCDAVALAPDRHGGGTNAIALSNSSRFPFAFGPGSFNRHGELAAGRARIVHRPGLALDIDTPADFAEALALCDLDGRVAWALSECDRRRGPFNAA